MISNQKNSISIIIPSFNQQEYLSDAIESALENKPDEIIVVDDGSTDNSLELARKYEKDGVKVISQVNKGLSSARNTGIMNSTSEFCLFLDADDFLLEQCVSKIKQVIDHNADVDIIAPSLKEFGIGNATVILSENLTIDDFNIGNRIGCCCAVRRSALLEIGGYSPRMIWGAEDLHLTLNLLTRGKKLITIPEVLWLYRVKEKSMWTETAKHKDDFLAQINKDFNLNLQW